MTCYDASTRLPRFLRQVRRRGRPGTPGQGAGKAPDRGARGGQAQGAGGRRGLRQRRGIGLRRTGVQGPQPEAIMEQQTLDHLRTWIGHREQCDDLITPSRVAALAATLDRDDPLPMIGDPLPPTWHWTLCVPVARQSAIGPDGHPARGGFLPPVPLPRRMWAGGRLSFPQPMRVGESVQRRSQVMSVEHKAGRSGDLVFVLVRHEYHGASGLAITRTTCCCSAIRH
jgi:hypothetical protein